jgi:hypothetical protein
MPAVKPVTLRAAYGPLQLSSGRVALATGPRRWNERGAALHS